MGLLAEGAGAAGADEGGAGWVHCCGRVRLKVKNWCMDSMDWEMRLDWRFVKFAARLPRFLGCLRHACLLSLTSRLEGAFRDCVLTS